MRIKRQWVVKVLGTLLAVGGLLLAVSPLLIRHYYRNREFQLWRDRHARAVKRLDTATKDGQRFFPLTELAQSALYLGLTNDARGYAQRLIAMAPQFHNSWNYGNAIHDGNEVLGRIAVREGRLDEAKRCLIEAGKTPGSPQLDSFGPDMGLAQDLLERGERETVLEYLKLCRSFWEERGALLDRWSREIKAGTTPDLQDIYQ
jgi:tetratricopeptide (TPR) repeat protein